MPPREPSAQDFPLYFTSMASKLLMEELASCSIFSYISLANSASAFPRVSLLWLECFQGDKCVQPALYFDAQELLLFFFLSSVTLTLKGQES